MKNFMDLLFAICFPKIKEKQQEIKKQSERQMQSYLESQSPEERAARFIVSPKDEIPKSTTEPQDLRQNQEVESTIAAAGLVCWNKQKQIHIYRFIFP